MYALTFHGDRTIRYERVADPRIEAPTDALVAVSLTAICGSDMHVYHERERGIDPGTVMGHEFVGRVLEVGAETLRVRPGDLVASPFTTCCGGCFYCDAGLTARCDRGQLYGWVADGVGLQGAQAELVRVPMADQTLMRVPETVRPEEALLLGDVFSTGFYCAEMGAVGPEQLVAVVGCGPVGLMGILGARERGARTIFAIDSIPERLALAARFGATPIDRSKQDPLTVILEATEGRGADVVLELVGSPAAARVAFELVRPGGVIAVVGVHTAGEFGFTPSEAYDKNLTYRVGRCPARRLMTQLLPLLEARKYPLGEILTHTLPLSRGGEGYALFDARRDGCVKVVLRPG